MRFVSRAGFRRAGRDPVKKTTRPSRAKNAAYQRKFVERQHAAGRVRVQLWITAKERRAVEALVKRLRRKSKR